MLQYVSLVGGSAPCNQTKPQTANSLPSSSSPPPLCPCSHHPKLTGLAQLQLNKKGIASVKTQFTNMTSPLAWLEI